MVVDNVKGIILLLLLFRMEGLGVVGGYNCCCVVV